MSPPNKTFTRQVLDITSEITLTERSFYWTGNFRAEAHAAGLHH